MTDFSPETLRAYIQSRAAEAQRQNNPAGWFEPLYQ
jgi:hypothetical protein